MAGSLVIRSAHDSGVLELQPAEESRPATDFLARFATGSLKADVRVYGPDGKLGLGEFFGGLAREWRGWDGERTWESLEGEVALRATHDRVGHVRLAVELVDRSGDIGYSWSARGGLMLEAGSLDAIARAAQQFDRAGGT
jgi:Family of unknown function (DUF6228)